MIFFDDTTFQIRLVIIYDDLRALCCELLAVLPDRDEGGQKMTIYRLTDTTAAATGGGPLLPAERRPVWRLKADYWTSLPSRSRDAGHQNKRRRAAVMSAETQVRDSTDRYAKAWQECREVTDPAAAVPV
jgi:hypothetical protein